MEKKRTIFLPLGKGNALKRMSALAFLIAIYIALSFLSIRFGNFSLSLASIPLIVSALLFGPIEATIICLLGEFVIQCALYGPGPTTIIWMVGPAIRPLFLGSVAYLFGKTGKRLEDRLLLFIFFAILAALLVTCTNTLALYLDALIVGYPYAFVLVETILRAVAAIATAIIAAFLSKPVIKALRGLLGDQ